jgi:hypothetical protein
MKERVLTPIRNDGWRNIPISLIMPKPGILSAIACFD